MTHSDPELVAQMLQGSEESFTALYRRRQPGVFRFALQMTGSAAIADDVTQETFLILLRQGGRYDASRGTVASFLYGIARKQVLKRMENNPCAEEVEQADSAASVLDELTRQETVEQVRNAVLRLPTQYREVIVLCDLQEVSYEDAAAILECPLGTVRSRLSRGREMLRRKLRLLGAVVGSVT